MTFLRFLGDMQRLMPEGERARWWEGFAFRDPSLDGVFVAPIPLCWAIAFLRLLHDATRNPYRAMRRCPHCLRSERRILR